MDRKLAHIEEITGLRSIPKADKIEVANVLGWEVIVGKGEFKVGDKVIYVEVDSILPPLPEFEFLKPRKYRIKTIMLKKQVSQGICFPISILPPANTLADVLQVGEDVTKALGIVKYDPQSTQEQSITNNPPKNFITKFLMRYKWYRKYFTKAGKRGWPDFIQKTDEERIQNFPNICEREKGTKFTSTEKVDGQSASYAIKRYRMFWQWKDHFEFYVCSRNIHYKTPIENNYWKIAKQLDIKKVLENLIYDKEDYIILQGEIIGEGIQKNKYKLKGIDFRAFNLIHSRDEKRCDDCTMRYYLTNQNMQCVPLDNNSFILKDTIQECVEQSKGKSQLAKINREGVVVRNYEKNISLKIINPDFLLEYQDEDEE